MLRAHVLGVLRYAVAYKYDSKKSESQHKCDGAWKNSDHIGMERAVAGNATNTQSSTYVLSFTCVDNFFPCWKCTNHQCVQASQRTQRTCKDLSLRIRHTVQRGNDLLFLIALA